MAKFLLKKKTMIPKYRKIKSLISRLAPSFFPAGSVEKQPQFKSIPLKRFIEVAMMKIINKKEARSEALSVNIPSIKNRPAMNSTQGRVTAKMFIKNGGRIL